MEEDLDNLLEAKFMLQSLVEIAMSFDKDFWAIFNKAPMLNWIEQNESMFICLFKLPLKYCYCYGYKYTDGDLRLKLVSLEAKDDGALETVITPFQCLPDGKLVFSKSEYEVKHYHGSFKFFETLSFCLHPTMFTRFIDTEDKCKCQFMDLLWKIDPDLRRLAVKIAMNS